MRSVSAAAAAVILLAAVSPAVAGRFGVGGMFGEPTGLSAKLWLGPRVALDAGAAWSVSGIGSPHLHLDVLRHFPRIVNPSTGTLPLYYGIGGRLRFASGDDEAKVGIRVPFGLEYLFAAAPVGAFVELVPVLDLLPAPAPGINAAVGFRLYL